ncbi:MAG: hypothetical protein IKC03_09890 [Oscillospiraceae bacterium]|nr:hypothetical protein [Oscillospiraceae bacterium]
MARRSAYSRHLSRITRQIRRMEDRGYTFDPSFKDSLRGKSARQLAQIKTKGLYKRSKLEIPDLETGEIKKVSGVEGRKFERSQSALKGAETKRQRRIEESKPVRGSSGGMFSDEIPDVSADVVDNLDAVLFKLGQPVAQMAEAKDGHLFPKSNSLQNYSQGAKNQMQRILEREVARLNEQGENGEAIVAARIYERSEEIDEAIGIVEYSAYMEQIISAVQTFLGVITGRSSRDFMDASSVIDNGMSLGDMIDYESESWQEI